MPPAEMYCLPSREIYFIYELALRLIVFSKVAGNRLRKVFEKKKQSELQGKIASKKHRRTKIMLLSTTAIVLVVIVTIEVTIIVMGNALTIFVFWTQRLRLKRTFLLLINLALADLFVGLGEALVLATNAILNGGNEILKIESPWWAFQVFGSSTSVLFLVLISLERVYSVLRPFRHRVTSTRAYVYSIVIVWVTGMCMSGVWLLTIYHNDKLYASLAYSLALFISLLIICTSYLTIRSRLQSTAPDHDLEVHRQASTENTLRMSKTFFIVIAVSLVFWLPAFVMVTRFRYGHNRRILFMFPSTGGVVCYCSTTGEFHGKSIRVQL